LVLGLFRGLFWVYFRVRLFWFSVKISQFVEVLVDGSKHCKLRGISFRHAPIGDVGTVLGKRKNAMRSR